MGIGQASRASRNTSACSTRPRSVRSPPITSTSASRAAPSARVRRRLVSPTRAWTSAVAATLKTVLTPLLFRAPRPPVGGALVGHAPRPHVHLEGGIVEHRPAEAQAIFGDILGLFLAALAKVLEDAAGIVVGMAPV